MFRRYRGDHPVDPPVQTADALRNIFRQGEIGTLSIKNKDRASAPILHEQWLTSYKRKAYRPFDEALEVEIVGVILETILNGVRRQGREILAKRSP